MAKEKGRALGSVGAVEKRGAAILERVGEHDPLLRVERKARAVPVVVGVHGVEPEVVERPKDAALFLAIFVVASERFGIEGVRLANRWHRLQREEQEAESAACPAEADDEERGSD